MHDWQSSVSIGALDTGHVASLEAELELKHNHFENWQWFKNMASGSRWSPLGATQFSGLVHNFQRLLICRFSRPAFISNAGESASLQAAKQ